MLIRGGRAPRHEVITIAYHLVRPTTGSWLSGIPAMSPEELANQLAMLSERYQIIGPDDLLGYLERGAVPDDACVLTFDDGYIGQFEHALPLLQQRALKAFFFIPTGVLDNAKCPIVEKQRVLQYALWPYPEFYRRFCTSLRNAWPDVDERKYLPTVENLKAAETYYAEYAFYTPLERLFRKVRETGLSGPQFDSVVDAMFGAEFDEREFVDRYFVRWEDVAELRRAGMEIGGHGHEHLIDTAVSPGVATADALRSLEILRARLGTRVWSYCYPYGIFRPETVAAIGDAGVTAAFTCRPGHGDAGSPLLLDRVDCRNVA